MPARPAHTHSHTDTRSHPRAPPLSSGAAHLIPYAGGVSHWRGFGGESLREGGEDKGRAERAWWPPHRKTGGLRGWDEGDAAGDPALASVEQTQLPAPLPTFSSAGGARHVGRCHPAP